MSRNEKAAAAPSNADLPLFYKKPIALDKNQHGNVSINKTLSFDFAAKVNAVPVTIIELPSIMQFYPIAFSATSPATPLAILGLRDQENLFVNDKGEWQPNTYIPAYIRRYPFIFARNDNGDRLTLCVDDTGNVLQKNKDNLIFDEQGELTPMTQNALEFCRSYQAAAEQTLAFSAALEKSDILVERHAEIRTPNGEALTLSGFRQVDEQKYHALPDATIVEWHKNYWAHFIYAHLFSTTNWQKLYDQFNKRNPKK